MKKPIAILITDFHLKEGNEDEVIFMFNELVETCKHKKVNTIYIAGDCFYHRKKQSMEILLMLKMLFDLLISEGMTIHCFPGNHDKTNQDSTLSYLNMYENTESVFVYEEIGQNIIGNINFLFLPFFTDEIYLNYLSEIKKNYLLSNKKNILLTHIAINGITNNDGSVVNNGIKTSLFSEFEKVFVGHYHNSSKLSKNIYYVGSTIPHNFGENDEKGFIIIYDDCSHELQKFNFNKYIKLTFDAVDKSNIDKALQKYKNIEDNVRFIFEGTTDELNQIDVKRFKKLGIDVKFKNKDISVYVEQAEEDFVFEFNNLMIKKEFIKYCKEISASKEQINFGLKYLKNV